ncbi:cofF, partial [Symbiodinium natans]
MTAKRKAGKGVLGCCSLRWATGLLAAGSLWMMVWISMHWRLFGTTAGPSSDLPDKSQEDSKPETTPTQLVLDEVPATQQDAGQDGNGHKEVPPSVTKPRLPRPGKGSAVKDGGKELKGGSCPQKPRRKEKWGEVVKEDMKIIKGGSATVATSCHRAGGALVFELRLQEAKRIAGHAYEMPLPDYIVADEPGQPGFERRSTLQLLAVLAGKVSVLGPAHADLESIQKAGGGAFAHWREPLSEGPFGTSKLRFSTPGNVDLTKISQLRAVVFPLSPRMGFVEFVHKPNKKAKDYDPTKRRRRKEIHRELFFQTFPTVGVEPHLADRPQDTLPGVAYLWRASHHDEFNLDLLPGEVFEKRMPYAFAEFFGSFEETGAVLYPPPACYKYYENKVALTELFQGARVQMPMTWVFRDLADAMARKEEVQLPVVIKDPYGYSSIGLLQAETLSELTQALKEFFSKAKPGVEALVQKKVQALREARVTYVDGRPFHGYWRIRQSLKSASAASTRGGYQDFNFPLSELAPFVARFANQTGIPVGGVDLIWQEKNPDLQKEPFTLEVSPTSDINPPSPPDWKEGYAEFKHTKGFRNAYIGIRRKWAEAMALAVVDRHRRSKRHLFIGMPALWHGNEKDEVSLAPSAAAALRQLQRSFFIRILAVPEDQPQDPLNSTLRLLAAAGVEYDDMTLLRLPEHRTHYLGKEALLLDILDKPSARTLQDLGVPFINLLEHSWEQ